jgi:hypothetical protein
VSNKNSKTGIVFIDTETSFCKLADFSLKNNGYINPDNIIQDWNIYCAAWKFLDEKEVHSISVKAKDPTNDKQVVKALREVLVNSILVIGHNLDKFDLKKFNARLIYHSLPPIDHKILTLDTYKAAKKHFSFTSNRLDYLGKFLGVACKKSHRDGNPWLKLINGIQVQETLDHMEEYCRHDVSPLLEKVYLRMRPYIAHPNLNGANIVEREACPNCGSNSIRKHGFRLTRTGAMYQRYICNSCAATCSEKIKEAPSIR